MVGLVRIHLLSIPNTIAAPWYVTCPFTQKVVKLAKMLTRERHHVIHYGAELSNVVCAENVTVVWTNDIERSHPWHLPLRDGPPLLNYFSEVHRTFLKNAIHEIGERKQPGDILLATFGGWHRPVAMHHPDLICIEPGIGYPEGVFADNRVFESYAIMHAYQTNSAAMSATNAHWYDAVIPIAFDPAEFIFRLSKEDYLLFMGRLHKGKGLHVAMQIAEATKQNLIVAGYGAIGDIEIKDTKYVKFVGSVAGDEKMQLLAGARAVICASHFLEPFNAVQIEAMMSGTPVISSDWGAFAEYNPHGLTGFRCKSFEQFCWAAKHVEDILGGDCRKWAERFSLERIAPHYTDYFKTVADAYNGGDGWFAAHPERKDLSASSFTNDAFF
jgi:glycosyltransferase involved in cell wall biosynthesis